MSKKEAFDRQSQSSKKGEQVESKKSTLSAKVNRMTERKAEVTAKKGTAIKAKHTVVSGDTLSGLATKYYGSGSRENWMAIYEANKEAIGDNPSLIRVGQVLQIPELE